MKIVYNSEYPFTLLVKKCNKTDDYIGRRVKVIPGAEAKSEEWRGKFVTADESADKKAELKELYKKYRNWDGEY